MATKSMQRTLALLTSTGIAAYVVEKFNPFAGTYGRREDFMGFIDIIALHPDHGIIGVQACGSDWSPHVKKIEGERAEAAKLWSSAGGRIWLVGWRKLKQKTQGGKQGKKELWTPRVAEWIGDGLVEVGNELPVPQE